ncbi:MAG: IclR family transcriptional regulator [Rhizobiaceae bacterium]|nr:IclR family transcriptional regulator [Rhizobiaceae bacterium]
MDAKSPPGSEESEHDERFAQRGQDRKFVVALARGLEVLRAFRVRDGFLGNHEIAERTGLPRPTVTRLTYTLCELGYLMHVPRMGKYQLAPSAIALGYAALANLGIRQVARPLMAKAADDLAAPIALGVLDRNRALYLDIARGSSTFTVQLDVGSRIPLAKTAMGWALIAAMDPLEREETFDRLAERHPREWPVLRAEIEAAVAQYPKKGYVRSPGHWRSDIHAVGVALKTADGSGIYAFNCGGPPHQFTPEKIETVYGPAMVKLVRDIELVLHGS